MKKIFETGFACCVCGEGIKRGDDVAICPDCGAIFCKECVDAGEFEKHTCDEDDAEVY